MSDKEIWIVSSKARPLEGCPIKFDDSEFYFVDCLVPASSNSEATAPLEHALRDEMFELEEILGCKPYVADEWKDEVQFPEVKDAALKASKTGRLAFALFISEPPEDDYDGEDDDVEWS